MARGRKRKVSPERVIKMKSGELKAAIVEAARLKDQAKTYTGLHGSHVKNFTERTAYSSQAFAVLLKMERLGDDLKRRSLMDEIVMGFDLMGWNDQGDLFDRVQERLASRVEAEQDDPDDDADQPTDPDAIAAGEAGVAPLKQDGMPLVEAEKAFKRNARKAPAPDALSSLAGDGAAFN